MNNSTPQTQEDQELYCVYLHTHTSSGKGYVGYTIEGITKRFKKHMNEVNTGSSLHFHRALRKYGIDAFRSEVIYVSFSKDDKHLMDVEILLIADYDTYNNGYNMTVGGEGVGSGKNHPMYGKKHTAEQNAAKSARMTGMKQTPERKAAIGVRQSGSGNSSYDHTIRHFIHKDGTTFTGTQYELRTKYDLHQGNLGSVIRGIINHTGGWHLVTN